MSKKMTDWRRRTKLKAVALLGNKCNRCGYNKCPWSLHFHHKDPSQKLDKITNMISCGQGWTKIQSEVMKCDLICANCHGELHYEEFIGKSFNGRTGDC